MRAILPILMVVLGGACAKAPGLPPEVPASSNSLPQIGATAPASWTDADYVAGLVLRVPPAATAVRPQGIDSAVLQIQGEGFTLSADNYGAFQEPADVQLAGRRAKVRHDRSPGCERLVVDVQLTMPSNMFGCDADGKNCRATPGVARLAGHCRPGEGCERLQTVIGSARFRPPPYPEFVVTDPDAEPKQPVCRMPDEL